MMGKEDLLNGIEWLELLCPKSQLVAIRNCAE